MHGLSTSSLHVEVTSTPAAQRIQDDVHAGCTVHRRPRRPHGASTSTQAACRIDGRTTLRRISRIATKYSTRIRAGHESGSCASCVLRQSAGESRTDSNVQEYDRTPSTASIWFTSDMDQMRSCVRHKIQTMTHSYSIYGSNHEKQAAK